MLLIHPIRELIELVDEIPDVYTTHRICLGKWHRLREPLPVAISARECFKDRDVHGQRLRFSGSEPAHSGHLVKLVLVTNFHWLIIIVGDDLQTKSVPTSVQIGDQIHLIKVDAEFSQEQFRVPLEKRDQNTIELIYFIAIPLQSYLVSPTIKRPRRLVLKLTSSVCTNNKTFVLLSKNTSGSPHPFKPCPMIPTIRLHISSHSSSTSCRVLKSGMVRRTCDSMMKKPTTSCSSVGRVVRRLADVMELRDDRIRFAWDWQRYQHSCWSDDLQTYFSIFLVISLQFDFET